MSLSKKKSALVAKYVSIDHFLATFKQYLITVIHSED